MKCKNCGAELNNGRCEYCGSVFLEDMRFYTLKTPQIDEDLLVRLIRKSPLYGDKKTLLKTLMEKQKDKNVIEVTCLSDSEPHYIEGV